MGLKSKLGRKIISEVLKDRRQDRILYNEYEEKRGLKEEVVKIEQRLDRLEDDLEIYIDSMKVEESSIPEDVSLRKESWGEYVLEKKKRI